MTLNEYETQGFAGDAGLLHSEDTFAVDSGRTARCLTALPSSTAAHTAAWER